MTSLHVDALERETFAEFVRTFAAHWRAGGTALDGFMELLGPDVRRRDDALKSNFTETHVGSSSNIRLAASSGRRGEDLASVGDPLAAACLQIRPSSGAEVRRRGLL